MNGIYVLIFTAADDKFVSAHFARSHDHAFGFVHGVKAVSKKHRVYVWPRDKTLINQQETKLEAKRARIAMAKDSSRREKEEAPKDTIDESCDDCPAKPGEWCTRTMNGKRIRRPEGFHASRVARAKGRSNG